MIHDHIDNLTRYAAITPHLNTVAKYMDENNLMAMTPNQYEVDGDSVFLLHQEFKPHPPAEAFWEAHRNYIDVQIILRGREQFGWFSVTESTPVKKAYDTDRDVTFFQPPANPSEDETTWFTVGSSEFVIFYPQDAHAPCVQAPGSGSEKILKAVFKILV